MDTSSQIVVGVDVGGAKKGFHAIALCGSQFVEKLCSKKAEEVAEWCRKLRALAIGIDAPCHWSQSGRARCCERELADEGIFAFATPSQSKGERHPFYRWMRNGMDLYGLLQPHSKLFDGGEKHSVPTCFETFPHAVACALARKILSAKQKRADRPRLLREAGLVLDAFNNIDMVDAALCAFTARHLLGGTFETYGDAKEGLIVVPTGSGTGTFFIA